MFGRNGFLTVAAMALTVAPSAVAFQQPSTTMQLRIRRSVLPTTFTPFTPLAENKKSVIALNVAANPSDFRNIDENNDSKKTGPGLWPCGDELDKRLMKIAIPMILAFMVTPLMGAIDLFFVSRMANPLAVAGQAASNQIYNTAFWLTSFLPSGTFHRCRPIKEAYLYQGQ